MQLGAPLFVVQKVLKSPSMLYNKSVDSIISVILAYGTGDYN